jgi:hypothetical protein
VTENPTEKIWIYKGYVFAQFQVCSLDLLRCEICIQIEFFRVLGQGEAFGNLLTDRPKVSDSKNVIAMLFSRNRKHPKRFSGGLGNGEDARKLLH